MIYKTAFLLSLVALSAAAPSYEEWKQRHGMNFVGAEDAQRKLVYESNVAKAQSLNKADDSAVYGLNEFAHLTEDEFRNTRLGLRFNADLKCATTTTVSDAEIKAAPAEMDWRAKGAVTPVKNQGGCGSCWAFSTTGDIEGTHFLKTGNLVSLSEQDLVDCDHNGDQGCNGGLMWQAFESIIQAGGIETEADYPYKGVDGTCAFDKTKTLVQISNYTCLPQDEEQIAAYLATNGPLSIGLNAGPLQFYMGGIINVWDIFCNPKGIDHGTVVVGYGVENNKPYWVVKNSWGEGWGEKGYFRIIRGKNKCGLASAVSHSIA